MRVTHRSDLYHKTIQLTIQSASCKAEYSFIATYRSKGSGRTERKQARQICFSQAMQPVLSWQQKTHHTLNLRDSTDCIMPQPPGLEINFCPRRLNFINYSKLFATTSEQVDQFHQTHLIEERSRTIFGDHGPETEKEQENSSFQERTGWPENRKVRASGHGMNTTGWKVNSSAHSKG